MADISPVEAYLDSVRAHLSDLPTRRRAQVMAEITDHLYCSAADLTDTQPPPPDPHPGASPGTQSGASPGTQSGAQSAAQHGTPHHALPQALPDAQPGAQPGTPPGTRLGAQPSAPPEAQSDPMPAALPGALPDEQPGAHSYRQHGIQPGASPGAQLGTAGRDSYAAEVEAVRRFGAPDEIAAGWLAVHGGDLLRRSVRTIGATLALIVALTLVTDTGPFLTGGLTHASPAVMIALFLSTQICYATLAVTAATVWLSRRSTTTRQDAYHVWNGCAVSAGAMAIGLATRAYAVLTTTTSERDTWLAGAAASIAILVIALPPTLAAARRAAAVTNTAAAVASPPRLPEPPHTTTDTATATATATVPATATATSRPAQAAPPHMPRPPQAAATTPAANAAASDLAQTARTHQPRPPHTATTTAATDTPTAASGPAQATTSAAANGLGPVGRITPGWADPAAEPTASIAGTTVRRADRATSAGQAVIYQLPRTRARAVAARLAMSPAPRPRATAGLLRLAIGVPDRWIVAATATLATICAAQMGAMRDGILPSIATHTGGAVLAGAIGAASELTAVLAAVFVLMPALGFPIAVRSEAEPAD